MSFTKIHLFIGTFMLVWCLSLSWSFLRVKSINCKLQLATQTKNCPQELTDKLLEQFSHQPLIFNQLEPKIAQADGVFGHYLILELSKTWPHQLNLLLKPDILMYQLKLKDKTLTLSASGIAHESIEQDHQLVLVTNQFVNDNLSTNTPPAFHQPLIHLIQEIASMNLNLKQIEFAQPNLMSLTFTNPEMTVLLDLNRLDSIKGLETIIKSDKFKQLSQSGKTIVVDLRFKLPVLRLN
jgi:hypothetical protein